MGKVAVKENTDIAVSNADFFAQYGGVGAEEVKPEDKLTPRLRIISAQSKELQRGDGKFMKGAAAGQILRTDTSELIDGEVGIEVIIAKYQRTMNIYEGERFKMALMPGDPLLREARQADGGKSYLPDGREVRDTANFFIILVEGQKPCMLSMASSQWKRARQINAYLDKTEVASNGVRYKLPYPATVWRLTTVPEKNDRGSWFGWSPTPVRELEPNNNPQDLELFGLGIAFAEQIGAGNVVVRHDDDATPERDKIPF